jgi:predicted ATPase
LTVDDLHNADEPFLALLQFTNQGFHKLRVLVVAAYSSAATSERPVARSAVESIGRHARHIELAELDLAATAKLLDRVAGKALDKLAVRRIHDLTGGNPGLILDTASSCFIQAGAGL